MKLNLCDIPSYKFWPSVFSDCGHAAFSVVLNFQCLLYILAVAFNVVVSLVLPGTNQILTQLSIYEPNVES